VDPKAAHRPRTAHVAAGAGCRIARGGHLLVILWKNPDTYTPKVQWTLTLVIVGLWWGFAGDLREGRFPLRTLANLLSAMREGDYSIRAGAPRATKTRWAT
jgi:hypothetical protein